MPVLSSVASLVPSMSNTAISVERRGVPTKDSFGVWSPSAATVVPLGVGIIHPADTYDVESLPEADRTRETVRYYATQPVQIPSATGDADVLLWQDRKYRVRTLDIYETQAGVWTGLAVLIDAQEATG